MLKNNLSSFYCIYILASVKPLSSPTKETIKVESLEIY